MSDARDSWFGVALEGSPAPRLQSFCVPRSSLRSMHTCEFALPPGAGAPRIVTLQCHFNTPCSDRASYARLDSVEVSAASRNSKLVLIGWLGPSTDLMMREMERAITRSAPQFARHRFAFASAADRETVLRRIACCLPSYIELELGGPPAPPGPFPVDSRADEDISTFLRLSHPSVLSVLESVEANIAVGGGATAGGMGNGDGYHGGGGAIAHFSMLTNCLATGCHGCEHCKAVSLGQRPSSSHHGPRQHAWGAAPKAEPPASSYRAPRRRRISNTASDASHDHGRAAVAPDASPRLVDMSASGIVRLPALPAKLLLWSILHKQYVRTPPLAIGNLAYAAVTVFAALPVFVRLAFSDLSGSWWSEPKTLALIVVHCE